MRAAVWSSTTCDNCDQIFLKLPNDTGWVVNLTILRLHRITQCSGAQLGLLQSFITKPIQFQNQSIARTKLMPQNVHTFAKVCEQLVNSVKFSRRFEDI